MGDPAKELQKKNDNNPNPINSAPIHTGHMQDDDLISVNSRIDQISETNQIDQININMTGQLRTRQLNEKMSTLKMFRDAVVVDVKTEEEVGQLNLPKIPHLSNIKKAWEKTDFAFTDSPKERSKLVEQSKRKRSLTLMVRAELKREDRIIMGHTLAQKDVVKLSDEKLYTRFQSLDHTDEYVKARLDLIKNRYYALVPEKEIKKLSRNEILNRLRKLYAVKGKERDYDLIEYYQNILIIRHREKEITEKNSQDRLLPEENEKKAELTPQKQAGIQSVIAWMRRNCDKSSISKSSFVDRIERAPAGRQLLMFYLVEKGLHAAPSDEYCYNALTDYVPDISKIKGMVVASKWKFWKRIGTDSSDSVIDWSRLGMASGFALNCDIPDAILQDETALKEAETAEEPLIESPEEKKIRLMTAMEKKGELILTLYRSVGLTPEMPAEIIEDKSLRERLLSLISSFNSQQEELAKLDTGGELRLKGSLNGKIGTIRTGVMAGEELTQDTVESMGTHSNTLSSTVKQLANTDKMLTYGVDELGSIAMNDAVTAATSGIVGVLGVLQLIANFKTAAGIANTASKLTTADHAARSIAVTGSILNNAADLSVNTTTVAQYFQGATVYTPQTSWLGETTVKTVGEQFKDVAGGVKFCAGCASIVAGALNMTAGAIEYGRSVSSRHDVKNAEDKLKAIPKGGRTEEHKQLELFLNHEKRVIKNNKISAGVRGVTGLITLAGGILTVTGILAPIGGLLSLVGSLTNLGYNLFYARHRRNLARKQAVDDSLNLDKAIKLVRARDKKSKNPQYAGFSDEVLRTVIRQEALAELGYATYKECFIDLCKKNALMLYKNVFEKERGVGEQTMYEDALKSLGLKIKYPKKPGEKPMPDAAAIYAKLMA